MADAGEVMAGKWGREFGGAAQTIFLIFSMGSHILTWTIAFNAMTDHGTCTIVFTVVGLIISFVLGLPRTFKNISYFSYFCRLKDPIAPRKLVTNISQLALPSLWQLR